MPKDSSLQQPAITNTMKETISYYQATISTITTSGPIALSYTFSFSIVLMAIMVGHLDNNNQDNLAATTLISVALQTYLAVSVSLLYSMSFIARYEKGAYDRFISLNNDENLQEINNKQLALSRLLRSGSIFAALITPLPFFAMYYSSSIFKMLGQNSSISDIAERYLRVYAFALPGLIFRVVFEQILFGFKKQFPVMLMGLVSFCIGSVLSYLFGFGKFGFPKLKLAGIAYGFLIDSYLITVALGLYLLFHKDLRPFKFFRYYQFGLDDFVQMKKILNVGWPITLSVISKLSASFLVSLFIGWLGTDQLTAQNISSQLTYITFILSFASGQTAGQLVSGALGEKNYNNANRLARVGLLTSVTVVAPFCLFAMCAPMLLKSLITKASLNSDTKQYLKVIVPMTAATVMFDTVRNNMIQSLRAAHDLVRPTVTATSALWVGVLCAFLFGFPLEFNIYGVTAGFSLGIVIGAILLLPEWVENLKPDALEKVENRIGSQQPSASSISLPNLLNSGFTLIGSCFGLRKNEKNTVGTNNVPNELTGLLPTSVGNGV